MDSNQKSRVLIAWEQGEAWCSVCFRINHFYFNVAISILRCWINWLELNFITSVLWCFFLFFFALSDTHWRCIFYLDDIFYLEFAFSPLMWSIFYLDDISFLSVAFSSPWSHFLSRCYIFYLDDTFCLDSEFSTVMIFSILMLYFLPWWHFLSWYCIFYFDDIFYLRVVFSTLMTFSVLILHFLLWCITFYTLMTFRTLVLHFFMHWWYFLPLQ